MARARSCSSTPPSVEETYRATVENFLPDLEAAQPIGVWYGAVFAGQGDAVEEAVFPILDENGIEYIPYRTDTLGPSDPEGAAILSAAATDFVSQGVGRGARLHPDHEPRGAPG